MSIQKSYYTNNVSLPDGDDRYGSDINNVDFGNVICWFWVENKDERHDPTGCSEIVECNPGSHEIINLRLYIKCSFNFICLPVCVHK